MYAVGGYLRDRLLGLPFRGEVDFSVVGDGPAFARAFAERVGHRGRVAVYRRFGTASFVTRGVRLEFATSRRESYREHSRNPIVEPAPFGEDLARRDFTINAIAIDCREPDRIVDPFAGRDDLAAKLIRTPLDPERTFSDDPLRILRAVRFAARLRFRIEPATWAGMVENARRLEIVAPERINDEFFQILALDPPSRGLLLLHECGALAVIYPEIDALAGVDQVGRHAHKDNLLHSIKVTDKVAKQTGDLGLRFAALVHDIGKPRTKRFEKGQGWTFHGHEHLGERMIRKMGRRCKWPDELTDRTAKLVRLHMRPMNLQDEGVTDNAIRRLVVQAGEDIDDLLTLCRADITSGNEKKVRRYLSAFDSMVERMDEIEAKDALRRFQSPIRGDEIMARTGLPESPRVGLIKTLIEEAILDGEIPNTRAGAERIFDEVVAQVGRFDDRQVLRRLRALSKARAEGKALPPEFDM
ncbi:MAG: Multifunctional CCA protein [Calditrichaeota bacterium]|nr:Multifunctional CCA protein [Calditrichota bacterium]